MTQILSLFNLNGGESPFFMIYHITPNNDLKEHEESSTCPCLPFIEEVEGSLLIVHNAFDKRDLTKDEMFKIGDKVVFKVDIRGFAARYVIEDISDDGQAVLLGRDHYWKTDPCIGKWYNLTDIKHYGTI